MKAHEVKARIAELEALLLTPITDRMVYAAELGRLKWAAKVQAEREMSTYYASKESIELHKSEWEWAKVL